jgi:hypothetical protein
MDLDYGYGYVSGLGAARTPVLMPRHAPPVLLPRRPPPPAQVQQQIAQLKAAIAQCQQRAVQDPRRAAGEAARARQLTQTLAQLEHAVAAASHVVETDNRRLVRSMVGGTDDQVPVPEAGENVGRAGGGGGGFRGGGGGFHGGGGWHGGGGFRGGGFRGGWGGGWGGYWPGYWPGYYVDYDPLVVYDPLLVIDDPYAPYPGMMGPDDDEADSTSGVGRAAPPSSPAPAPRATSAPSSGNLGCAAGSCGTGIAPPSVGTFTLPGFGRTGPPNDGTGYGPS